MTFGERLAIIRVASGATQQQLADYCRVSRPTVNQWEKGRKKPGRDKLPRLADFFRISIDDLLQGTPHAASWPAAADEAETLRLLRLAPPSVRAAILTLLRVERTVEAAEPRPTDREISDQ